MIDAMAILDRRSGTNLLSWISNATSRHAAGYNFLDMSEEECTPGVVGSRARIRPTNWNGVGPLMLYRSATIISRSHRRISCSDWYPRLSLLRMEALTLTDSVTLMAIYSEVMDAVRKSMSSDYDEGK